MKISLVAGLLLSAGVWVNADPALAAPPLSHGEAHICTTRAFMTLAPMNDAKYKYLSLDDATVFKCPAPIGDKTIPQLAAAGWRVDMPVELPAGPMHTGMPGPPLFAWKILIQKH